MAEKTLYDKRNDVDYNHVTIYDEEDVKEAIKNTLRDINFDHVNGPWHARTIFDRINKSFGKNFGDALLGDSD